MSSGPLPAGIDHNRSEVREELDIVNPLDQVQNRVRLTKLRFASSIDRRYLTIEPGGAAGSLKAFAHRLFDEAQVVDLVGERSVDLLLRAFPGGRPSLSR